MKNILDNFEFLGDTANDDFSSLYCKYCKEELRIPFNQPVEIAAHRITLHLRDCEKFKERLK